MSLSSHLKALQAPFCSKFNSINTVQFWWRRPVLQNDLKVSAGQPSRRRRLYKVRRCSSLRTWPAWTPGRNQMVGVTTMTTGRWYRRRRFYTIIGMNSYVPGTDVSQRTLTSMNTEIANSIHYTYEGTSMSYIFHEIVGHTHIEIFSHIDK